jgi:hypothetical protein
LGRAWSWLILVAVIGGDGRRRPGRERAPALDGGHELRRGAGREQPAGGDAAWQETALDGYLDSGEPRYLGVVYDARRDLSNGLADARELSSDAAAELRQIAVQSSAFAQWTRTADAAIRRRRLSGREDTRAGELQRNAYVARFLAASNAYEQRLAVNRDDEERAAPLLPVWPLVGLGGLLAASLPVVELYRRSRRKRRDLFAAAQTRFVEAIQFAGDE